MIVQSAPEGAPHFVVSMIEHGAFAGRFARAFGNDVFEPFAPRDEMLFAVDNHDRGWAAFDERPRRNPQTGLPWNLVETPSDIGIQTLALSPDANEAHHQFCGLLVAMHMHGVYTGRRGITDRILLDRLPKEVRPSYEAELESLRAREETLRSALARDPDTADWVEEGALSRNYKRLQFFDSLALYFNYTAEGARDTRRFPKVPLSAEEDVTVEIKPVHAGTYALDPFPFSHEGVEVHCEGRYLRPVDGDDAALADALRNAPTDRQVFCFVAG